MSNLAPAEEDLENESSTRNLSRTELNVEIART